MKKKNGISIHSFINPRFALKVEILTALSIFFLLTLNIKLFSQTDTQKKVEYYKVSEVRVFINDPSEITDLRKQGLSFENIKLQDTYFDVQLDSLQISKLKKTGYAYEIIIDDLTKDYLERTKESREKIKAKKAGEPTGFGYGSMGGFYTFSEVVAQLDSMRARYPNLITAKDSIGASVEGRTIWAVKISDNPDVKENEPEVFYNALTHGNEQQGMMAVMYFMFYMLENYGADPEVTYLVNNREIYFVPVINPDGYCYNEQISPEGGGMWRRNRRDYGGGIFGVDLNRNYGYMWGFNNNGSDPNPGDINYRGTGPFSEPETQAVREFCLAHDFIIGNSFHVPIRCVFPPWAYNLMQSPDSVRFNSLIKLATSINDFRNGIYIPTPENAPANGDVGDWMYGETSEKNRIYGVVTEVSSYADGFWPVPEKIFYQSAENLYLCMVFAWGPGIIENPPYISEGSINVSGYIPQKDTLISFEAIEHNPDNHTSNAYAQLLNSKDSIIQEILLAQTDSTFDGSLDFSSQDEDFYKIRYKQIGIDIPSNLYYSDKSKLGFTTVGPVVLDSISIKKNATSYSIAAFIRNESASTKIKKASVKVICNDSWALPISGNVRALPDIAPGGVVVHSGTFLVKYIDALFNGIFNIKVEILSDGVPYWTDSMKIDVGTKVENLQAFSFNLRQNYPNPFNSMTTISWQIPKAVKATLKVYDISGREVATLFDGFKPTGKYESRFNAGSLPGGVYFYKLSAGEFTAVRKMLLIK
jgi:hypothetical protein